MKKLLKLSLVTFISLFIFSSCSDDQEEPIEIKQIEITELSSNFLFKGEVLTITGNNFINEHYSTKIRINDDIYDITPTSNTRIDLELIDDYGIEKKDIRILISDRESNEKYFFIMTKDWYKVSEATTRKIFLHEGINEFIALGYSTIENQSNWGWVVKYITNENGFSINQDIDLGNGITDLKMLNKNIGVATGTSRVYYTLDGFKTSNNLTITENNAFLWGTFRDFILDVDENGYKLGGFAEKHFLSNDQGNTYTSSIIELPTSEFTNIYKRGKGTNSIYYEFGIYYHSTSSNIPPTKITRSSPNGFDNWTIIDNSEFLPYSNLRSVLKNLFFYDYDLIYSINENRELIKSTDLTLTWQFVKSNVDAFFIKNETEWYMVSDDKLYHTTNSGIDWTFELDLPAGSTANDMSFTSNKIAIAGSNYIYIKHL